MYPNCHSQSPRRTPITLVSRKVEFICAVCQKKGQGPPGTRTHPGTCHDEHVKILAKKSLERRKNKPAAAPTEDINDYLREREQEQRIARACGEDRPPQVDLPPHPFRPFPASPCCARCGGGILHDIHSIARQHA
jgi:hypothetical protein